MGRAIHINDGIYLAFVRELLISKHSDRAFAEPFDLTPAKKAASKTRPPLAAQ